MASLMLLMSCAHNDEEESNTITSRFNCTWNIYESVKQNGDGSVTYNSIPWGGLVGVMSEHNMPVDWSRYESITVEFSEPTTVTTQLKISRNIRVYGKPGISKMVYYFDGQKVNQIDEVILQTSDSCSLTVNRVYLTPGISTWTSTPIWEGECNFGNFEHHIIVEAEEFRESWEGDQLEFIYKNDQSDPSIEYWNIKTIYQGTDKTLEGNASLLNEWGCASLGESGVFRIRLSANDVKELRKRGLMAVGFHSIVSKVNLLKKDAVASSE